MDSGSHLGKCGYTCVKVDSYCACALVNLSRCRCIEESTQLCFRFSTMHFWNEVYISKYSKSIDGFCNACHLISFAVRFVSVNGLGKNKNIFNDKQNGVWQNVCNFSLSRMDKWECNDKWLVSKKINSKFKTSIFLLLYVNRGQEL